MILQMRIHEQNEIFNAREVQQHDRFYNSIDQVEERNDKSEDHHRELLCY